MAVPERVPVLVWVLLRVAADVRVGALVLENDFVTAEVAVNDRDTVDDGVSVPLAEAELDALELLLDDPEPEEEADDDELIVAAPDALPVAVAVLVGVGGQVQSKTESSRPYSSRRRRTTQS